MMKSLVVSLFSLLFLVACTSTPREEALEPTIATESHSETHQENVIQKTDDNEPESKGISGNILLDNAPTKQILNSLESVADTLNVLSFGIFAAERT